MEFIKVKIFSGEDFEKVANEIEEHLAGFEATEKWVHKGYQSTTLKYPKIPFVIITIISTKWDASHWNFENDM